MGRMLFLIFLLHLSAAWTCHATSRNLLFAGPGHAADNHHHHTAKADVFSDYTGVRHYRHNHDDDPAMMARWGGEAPPRTPSTSTSSDEGAPPPPAGKKHTAKADVFSDYTGVRHYRHHHDDDPAMMARPLSTSPSVELAGIEGSPPPPPGKQGTSAAMEPSPSPISSSDASAAEKEASAAPVMN